MNSLSTSSLLVSLFYRDEIKDPTSPTRSRMVVVAHTIGISSDVGTACAEVMVMVMRSGNANIFLAFRRKEQQCSR